MSQAAIELPGARPRGRGALRGLKVRWLVVGAALAAVLAILVAEGRSSRTQARLFHALAAAMQFEATPLPELPAVSAGPPGAIAAPSPWRESAPDLARSPHGGPYDERLGHDRVPELAARALARGFRVERETRHSLALRAAHQLGLAVPYREKPRAGLRILGRDEAPLFAAGYPERVYERFDDVPGPVVAALLFAENRELLDPSRPTHNPVLEWDRLVRAAFAYPLHRLDPGGRPFGGSTLATQIQKFRHSPGGRTGSPADKLRQILSASLHIYRDGEDTTEARREVVLDYLNGVPLAALPGYGEVFGVPDGLRLWMSADFARTNELLRMDPDDPGLAAERGRAFRQVLSLVLAAQRPSYFLRWSPADLDLRVETYLELMAAEGVVAPRLAVDALAAGPVLAPAAGPGGSGPPEADREAAAPVRAALGPLLGTSGFYELDRLDLTAESTLDAAAQREATELLRSLRDPDVVRELGLVGPRLLGQGDPRRVNYSLALYERAGGANLLRVQTDSLPGPFDLNDGARMDLGSTAKLRTLIAYLEVVAACWREYAGLPRQVLLSVEVDPSDAIGSWVVARLVARPDLRLEALLEESLERRYSASPWETFFTGGGRHRFHNFDEEDDRRVLSVREAFRRSVNLVFVRLMRDLARHHAASLVFDPTRLVADASDPRRRAYLERYAEHEARLHLDRFRRRHRGKPLSESIDLLVPAARRTPDRLAAVLRYIEPDASPIDFAAELAAHGAGLPYDEAAALYVMHAPDRWSLADRSYIARVHPLELWLVAHLRANPQASASEILAASAGAREESSAWLFRTRRKGVRDRAVRIVLEQDAFAEIHRSWRRLGYPFPDLVPSYASAIGSSGDRPSALAELVGILLADGMREPTRRIERLRLAEGTPWETVVGAAPARAERVLAPEIAGVARRLLLETVEKGTARRAYATLRNAGGAPLAIGGKTGTGDHRLVRFGRHGEILESQPRARTASFAFFLGDRYFGVLTASVSGPEAADYTFTSALPVELVRVLAPILERTIAASDAADLRAFL